MKFIAKKGTWFDEGTEAVVVAGPWNVFNVKNEPDQGAIFWGLRNGKDDEEGCVFSEFDITE